MDWSWSLRNPDGGMNGLEFAAATTASDQRRVLVHSSPSELEVEVTTGDGDQIVQGRVEHQGDESPMSVLDFTDGELSLKGEWLTDEHLGLVVILPGGEAGILKSWEHADDRSWWKWTVEFSNQAD
jgi:hypothetical protein